MGSVKRLPSAEMDGERSVDEYKQILDGNKPEKVTVLRSRNHLYFFLNLILVFDFRISAMGFRGSLRGMWLARYRGIKNHGTLQCLILFYFVM